MITWIQRYFQHHFKTVFAILLVLIIISFVFITNTSGGFGQGDRRMVDRPFFGYNLSLQSDQQRLQQEAQISFSVNPNYEYYTDPNGFMLRRAAKLHLANQWHIPTPTAAEITEAIKKLRMFTGADGQFDAKRYQEFRDSLKTGGRGITEADVLRVLGDDLRAEKVAALLAGPGFVSAADVKQNIKAADTTWTLGTATTEYNAFKPEIKPTDAELTKAFEESGTRYDLPARVSASYIEFPAASFLPAITVSDAEVRQYYDANPARFPNPTKPAPNPATPNVTPPATPDIDFAIVRSQVEFALKQEQAKKRAVQAAADFAVNLYQSKVTPATLETYLAGRKLALKPLAPFTQTEGPAELGRSPAVAAEAFKLNQDRPISQEAVETPTGAVILVWKETQPSRRPLFTEVRDKVQADFVENERRKRFIDAGRATKAQLEARLKAGDTFDKAVAAAGTSGLKLEAKTFPAFSLRQPPQGIDSSLFASLETLEQGQVSDLELSGDKGVFVYAIEKKAPDLTDANPRFAEARKQLATSMGRVAATSYIDELVEKELERGKPKTE